MRESRDGRRAGRRDLTAVTDTQQSKGVGSVRTVRGRSSTDRRRKSHRSTPCRAGATLLRRSSFELSLAGRSAEWHVSRVARSPNRSTALPRGRMSSTTQAPTSPSSIRPVTLTRRRPTTVRRFPATSSPTRTETSSRAARSGRRRRGRPSRSCKIRSAPAAVARLVAYAPARGARPWAAGERYTFSMSMRVEAAAGLSDAAAVAALNICAGRGAVEMLRVHFVDRTQSGPGFLE